MKTDHSFLLKKDINRANKINFRREHDDETQAVLDVKFLPWYQSTRGLTRPNSPQEEHRQRYQTILNKSINEPMLSRLESDVLDRMTRRANRADLVEKLAKSVRLFKSDAERHYLFSMKKAIIDYVLKDEDEQKRLGIEMTKKVLINITNSHLILL